MPTMDDDLAPGALQDGAVFAPTRVRGARSPRLLVAIVLIAIAGLAAFGALQRPPTGDTAVVLSDPGPGAAESTDPAATAGPQASRSSRPPAKGSIDVRSSDPSRRPGELALDIRSAGSHLFVHGDVYSIAVTRVLIRIEDAGGNVAGTSSVNVPGGSTAFRLGAVPRFDVQFDLADEVQADGYVVAAIAFDGRGRLVDTFVQVIPRSRRPM